MNTIRIYGLLISLWCGLLVPAWTQSLDSLKQELVRVSNVEEKAILWNALSWAAHKNHQDSAHWYAQEALTFAQSQHLEQASLVAHLQLAEILRKQKALAAAQEQLETAALFFEKKAYPLQKPRFLLFRGTLKIAQRQYAPAIVELQESYATCAPSNWELRNSILNALAKAHQKLGEWEQAEVYIKKRLASRAVEDSISVLDKLGASQIKQQNFAAALPFYRQSLDLAAQHQAYKAESRAALNMGNIFLIEGRWLSAINYYSRSGALKEKLGDQAGLAILHNNIASIYKDQNRYDESLVYYEKSQEYYEEMQDSVELAKTWVNIAVIKMLQGASQEGIHWLQQARPIIEQANDAATLLIIHLNMAFVYSEVGKYQLALNYLKLAERAAQDQNDWYALTTIINLYGAYYFYIKEYDKAVFYYGDALRLGQELEDLEEQKVALFGLYESTKQQQQYTTSLEWLEQYNGVKDSLSTLQTSRQLVDLQEKYEAQEKEQEITRLEVMNDNIALESQLKSRQINFLVSSSILVILIMLLLSAFFYNRQHQQKVRLQHAQELHKERVNQLLDKQALETLDAVFQAQQKERKSLAKDIHDNLGSFLATLKYQHEATTPKQGEEEPHQVMEGLIEQAYEEVRTIAHQMATGEGVDFDLLEAIQALVTRIQKTQQFELDFQHFGEESQLAQAHELLLYRIVQELFSNVLKHAAASQATLQINKGEEEWLVILEDNGKGFDPATTSFKGLGWTSIQERLKEIQGHLEIDSYQGRGTTIVLTIPTAS